MVLTKAIPNNMGTVRFYRNNCWTGRAKVVENDGPFIWNSYVIGYYRYDDIASITANIRAFPLMATGDRGSTIFFSCLSLSMNEPKLQ
jgi:hypothetical protein